MKSAAGDAVASTQALSYKDGHEVRFLHRTTVNFFKENAHAREFLSTNFTAGFDPYQLYVKAELGTMILFTMSERGLKLYAEEHANVEEDWNDDPRDFVRFVDSIMSSAYVLECHATTAHIPLMENIDGTVSRLYERYDQRSPPLNWCSRWNSRHVGVLEEHGACKSIRELRNGKEARSWSLHQPQSNHETSQPYVPTRSDNFLSLAACFGLHNYVLQSLRSYRCDLDVYTATYLLPCAWYYGLHDRFAQQAELVILLLAKGACSNVVSDNETQWYQIMLSMIYGHERGRLDHEIMIRIVMAYLGNDVNVHETIRNPRRYTGLTAGGYGRIRRALGPAKVKYSGSLDLDVIYPKVCHSPLAIFQHYLRSGPNYGKLHEMAVAKGARLESKLQGIAFGCRWEPSVCELSELQLSKINRAFDKSFGHGWILPAHRSCQDPDVNKVLTCLVQALSDEDDGQDTKPRHGLGEGGGSNDDDDNSDEDNSNDNANDDDENDSMYYSISSSSENEAPS